ncbi:hypothetical protein D3C72_1635800 [compost metagenome]
MPEAPIGGHLTDQGRLIAGDKFHPDAVQTYIAQISHGADTQDFVEGIVQRTMTGAQSLTQIGHR